jgi:predicted transcriptional regulator
MISVADVLKAISDNSSLALLRIVALTKPDTDFIISKTNLTRKQYYSRMSALVSTGLIKRTNGKYTMTAFGKLIYYALIIMENATSSYWKLKAIDSLEMSNELPTEEHKKIIDSLIDNQEIKDVLVSSNRKFESTGPYDVELLKSKSTNLRYL